MYYNIAVAVENKGKKVNDVAREANELLSKFDVNIGMQTQKRYLTDKEIKNISEEYKIKDNNEISEKIEEWFGGGRKGFVDEKGVFEISTQNPDGQFDHFEVFYYATPDDFEGKILGGEWPRVRSFVTPELEWVDGYWSDIESAVASGEEDEYYAWRDKLVSLLEKYKDCSIFIVRCHS